MSTFTITWFDALRERLIAFVPKRWPTDAAKKERAAKPIPVRDWIDTGSQPTRLAGFDQALVCVVIALLGLGVVMVYSATVALPDSPKFAQYAPTYFMTRQIVFVAIALLAALVAVQIRSPSGRRPRRGSSSRRCCCSWSCSSSAKA